jgi:hypothetical protein
MIDNVGEMERDSTSDVNHITKGSAPTVQTEHSPKQFNLAFQC